MGTVSYMKRRKLTGNLQEQEPKKTEITGTNVVSFPITEREIESLKTCKFCKMPFRGEVCPDCGPDAREGGDENAMV